MSSKRRSNGEGSVYRRKSDGRWVAEIQSGFDPKTGKPLRHHAYAPADAKESVIVGKLHDLRERLKREGFLKPKTSTVRDFFERWLDARKKIVRHRTHENEERAWRLYIAPQLGGRQLATLTRDDLAMHAAQLETIGVGDRTRLLVHTTLSLAFDDAIRSCILATNPMRLLPRPRYRAPEKTALSATQAKKLAKIAAADRLGATVILALFTGLRQGEIFGLRWDDIDFAKSSLAVRRSVTEIAGKPTIGETKNASSRRAVFLAPLAIDALKAHRKCMMAESHGSAFVFVTPTGELLQKSNFIRRVFHPIRDAADLPSTVTFHALRHTTATLLLEANVHPKIVSEMLGFSTTSILLETYSHVNPTLQKGAASALNKALAPVGAPSAATRSAGGQKKKPR